MERNFALYDSDVFYVTRFMEYFRKRKDLCFDIYVFTRREALLEFLETHTVEVLLIHEGLSLEEIPLDRVRHRYQLAEVNCCKTDEAFPKVFKYQTVTSLMEEITKDYFGRIESQKVRNRSEQIRIIGIHSLRPEEEALAFTWSLCSLLALQRRVLLVMLDPLPVAFISEVEEQGNCLSEFIYYLKENSNIISKQKELSRESNGIFCLYGITHGSDLLSLNREDMERWVKELRACSDYQIVVLYHGGYTEAGNESLRLSDCSLLLKKAGRYQKELYKIFCKQMDTAGIHRFPDKFIEILLPEDIVLDQIPFDRQGLSHTIVWRTAEQYLEACL